MYFEENTVRYMKSISFNSKKGKEKEEGNW